mgnify:FL=1
MELNYVLQALSRHAAVGLINGLAAGAMLTLGVAVVLRFFRRLSAGTRYAVWWITLAAVVGLTVGFTAVSMAPSATDPIPARGTSIAGAPPPPTGSLIATSIQRGSRIAPPVQLADGAAESTARWSPLIVTDNGWVAVLVIGWAAGAVWGLIRLGCQWLKLSRFKRRARPITLDSRLAEELAAREVAVRRIFRLAVAPGITVPTVAGFRRPLILIPESMSTRLTVEEFRQVVLHEAAHLRRWDDWANLLQQVMAALFFCQPAVRWIGRRLSEEREIACDDWVVSVTGRRRSYILCLSRVLELAAGAGAVLPAPGAVHNRQILRRRIEMLLDKNRNHNPQPSRWLLLGAIGLLCLTAFLIAR